MEEFLKNRKKIKKTSYRDEDLVSTVTTEEPAVIQPLEEQAEEQTETLAIETQPEQEEIPKVEMISENGSLKRIFIQCTCGKCLELECEYDEELIDNLRKLKRLKR